MSEERITDTTDSKPSTEETSPSSNSGATTDPGQGREPNSKPAAVSAPSFVFRKADGTLTDLSPADLESLKSVFGGYANAIAGGSGIAPAAPQVKPSYQAAVPKKGVSPDNLTKIGYVLEAISQAVKEACSGNKSYDLRMPIERVSVALDEQDSKLLMVNIECSGQANQNFHVSLHEEDEKSDTDG